MRLLDLFCGAGGAAMGYSRAGFDEIVGVDINPQPRYPFEFVQMDAMDVLRHGWHVDDGPIDVIHASPPCQAYTVAQNASKNAAAHPDLIHEVRECLEFIGLPYVIENVVGSPLRNYVQVCGLGLGMNVRRHRWFESNLPLMGVPCSGDSIKDYFVIFGHEVRNRRKGTAAGRKNCIAVGREAMGIEWMTRGELSQAIPPDYTEFIGSQLIAQLEKAS